MHLVTLNVDIFVTKIYTVRVQVKLSVNLSIPYDHVKLNN